MAASMKEDHIENRKKICSIHAYNYWSANNKIKEVRYCPINLTSVSQGMLTLATP